MNSAGKRGPHQSPDGCDAPLAILIAILINAIALLVVVGPLISAHLRA